MSQISKATSRARAKLSLLTMMKSGADPLDKEYQKQLRYFSKASMFKLNEGQAIQTKKKNYKQLASNYLDRSTSLQSKNSF